MTEQLEQIDSFTIQIKHSPLLMCNRDSFTKTFTSGYYNYEGSARRNNLLINKITILHTKSNNY